MSVPCYPHEEFCLRIFFAIYISQVLQMNDIFYNKLVFLADKKSIAANIMISKWHASIQIDKKDLIYIQSFFFNKSADI